jgi:hypothetical protein
MAEKQKVTLKYFDVNPLRQDPTVGEIIVEPVNQGELILNRLYRLSDSHEKSIIVLIGCQENNCPLYREYIAEQEEYAFPRVSYWLENGGVKIRCAGLTNAMTYKPRFDFSSLPCRQYQKPKIVEI